MEIEIRRSSLWGLAALAGLALLLALGYGLSPRDDAGRPRLWFPDVRAVEAYRQSAAGWAQAWRELDSALGLVVASRSTDLLPQSRQAQSAFDQALDLARQVDGREAPATLLGLREQAITAATQYTAAAMAANRWLSAPTDENLAAAQANLAEARAALASLEANQWLARTPPATAPANP